MISQAFVLDLESTQDCFDVLALESLLESLDHDLQRLASTRDAILAQRQRNAEQLARVALAQDWALYRALCYSIQAQESLMRATLGAA